MVSPVDVITQDRETLLSLLTAADEAVQRATDDFDRHVAMEQLGAALKCYGFSFLKAMEWAADLIDEDWLPPDHESHLAIGYASESVWRDVPPPDYDDVPKWVTIIEQVRDFEKYYGATAPVDFILHDSVWEFSPVLDHIYRAAVSRRLNPGAVLLAVLAHLASLQNHRTHIDTGKGRRAALNLYLALIAESGGGKTQVMELAADLVEPYERANKPLQGYVKGSLGSGEGLVEAFMGKVDVETPMFDEKGVPLTDDDGAPLMKVLKNQRRQVRHNALFRSDEGRKILTLGTRTGSTLFSNMCSWWAGTDLGESNSDPDKTRYLERGTYVGSVILGFQTDKVDELFADSDGGLPQRFLYTPTAYGPGYFLDDAELPDYPGPLDVPAMSGELPGVSPYRGWTITLPDFVRAEMGREEQVRLSGRSTDGLGAHQTLLRVKVAGLLAILHGSKCVTAELWELSAKVMNMSNSLRDFLGERVARKVREAAEQADMRVVQREVTAHQYKRQIDSGMDQLNTNVSKLLTRLENGDTSANDVRRAMHLSKQDFDATLSEATRRGQVKTYDGEKPARGPVPLILALIDD